jgi:CHASE3 domain sensor protein
MNQVSKRSLLPVLVLSFVLLAMFATAALVVRGYISRAFATSQHLAAARQLADRAFTLQLDEETGVRGYAATGDKSFLDPYENAKGKLDAAYAQLHGALADNATKRAYMLADDAWFVSGRWNRDVALPIIEHPRKKELTTEIRGKAMVDRIRDDIHGVDRELMTLENGLGTQVSTAVDQLNAFVLGASGVFVVLVVLYGLQLLRISDRLAAQERSAANERRERAELYAAFEAEKRIADTLQEAFTHRPLPMLEPLRFSASYVPATEDTKVGGDWYDVMALSENRVLFAIGDVTGHGIEAAVTMNVARQSLISSALLDADPGAVLARANAEIFSRETRLVTAIAGVADAATFEFCYAVAGHPPPVLLEPGRPPRMLECGSLPLGAVAGTTYGVRRVQTVPGAVLVLYTDGAVEHSRNVIEGEKLLLQAIDAARESSETDIATFVHGAIFSGRSVGDDVAILTIGFAADATRGLVVSAERASAAFSSRVEPRAAPNVAPTVISMRRAS